MALPTFVALCSAVLGKPLQPSLVILGTMSLGGNIVPVENLADTFQVAFDAGAKRILLPLASVSDIPTIPGELFAKSQTSFYSDPRVQRLRGRCWSEGRKMEFNIARRFPCRHADFLHADLHKPPRLECDGFRPTMPPNGTSS